MIVSSRTVGLAGEPVADDQLALAASDRDHGVDRLDACLHRAVHALACDDARGDPLDRHGLGGLDRPLAVERLAERVDHPADQLVADRHLEQPAGRAHLVALVEVAVVAEDHGANLVLFEVERQAVRFVGEFEQLTGHRVLQAVDLRDAVARGDDAPDVGRHQARLEVLQSLLDDI